MRGRSEPAQKTTGRRPKPKKTTSLPGYWAAKRALQRFGSHVIDGRTRVSRGLDALKEQIVRDLGGQVSKQQEIVLTNILKEYLLLESVDNFLLSLPNIVNKKRRALLLIVKDRMQLADALMRHLSVLGLKKELKPIAALTQDLEGQGLELAKPAVRQEEEESEAANDESENGNHPTDAH